MLVSRCGNVLSHKIALYGKLSVSAVDKNGELKDFGHDTFTKNGKITITEKNGKVTVTMLYWDSSITLERVGGNQLKVTAVKGNATVGIGPLKVGDVFTWSK